MADATAAGTQLPPICRLRSISGRDRSRPRCALLGWVLILGFASILIAIFLHVVAERLKRWTPLPHWADLLIAGLIVLAHLGVWIFGTQLSTEFNDVMKRVQAGLQKLQDLLHNNPTGQFVLSRLSGADVSICGIFGTVVTTVGTALEALIVMSAAYLAAEPAVYRVGGRNACSAPSTRSGRTTSSSRWRKRSGTGCWDNSSRWSWSAH